MMETYTMEDENGEEKEFTIERDAETGRIKTRKGVTNTKKNSEFKQAKAVRTLYQHLVEANIPAIQDALDEVRKENPAKFIELVTSLSEYVLPKLSRQEVKQENTNKVIVIGAKNHQQQLENTINTDYQLEVENDEE